MLDRKSSYRNIVKGTAIFGGTQIYNIFINVVRGKLIAMILGPVGMGVSAMLTSAIAPIQQLSTLGLPYSAVRSISSEKDEVNRKDLVKSFRILMLITAIVGSVITVSISPWLSKMTFGNFDYSWSFVLLSMSLFFYVLNQCNNSILQGYRRLKSLALCNMIGPTAGLLIGVPLYYIYGIDGIVPAMIILSFVSYFASYWGIRKIDLSSKIASLAVVWRNCKGLIGLGIIMMVGSALGNLANFSLNAVIRSLGSLADVGMYQAANSIINQYVGMVIAAIATDYYPHLSSIIHDNAKTRELVKEEGEITLLIITPLAVLIIITAPLIIQIFLTSEFNSVLSIIRFMGLGVILKAAVFPLGYLALAHGDKTFFFCVDGLYSNIKTFVLFSIFYYFWGFTGLGYAIMINSLLDIIIVTILNKWRYNISYSSKFMSVMFIMYGATALCLICSFVSNVFLSYALMMIVGTLICVFCIRELDKRMDVRGIIENKILRNSKIIK